MKKLSQSQQKVIDDYQNRLQKSKMNGQNMVIYKNKSQNSVIKMSQQSKIQNKENEFTNEDYQDEKVSSIKRQDQDDTQNLFSPLIKAGFLDRIPVTNKFQIQLQSTQDHTKQKNLLLKSFQIKENIKKNDEFVEIQTNDRKTSKYIIENDNYLSILSPKSYVEMKVKQLCAQKNDDSLIDDSFIQKSVKLYDSQKDEVDEYFDKKQSLKIDDSKKSQKDLDQYQKNQVLLDKKMITSDSSELSLVNQYREQKNKLKQDNIFKDIDECFSKINLINQNQDSCKRKKSTPIKHHKNSNKFIKPVRSSSVKKTQFDQQHHKLIDQLILQIKQKKIKSHDLVIIIQNNLKNCVNLEKDLQNLIAFK